MEGIAGRAPDESSARKFDRTSMLQREESPIPANLLKV
jgi:hypothetical protein